MIKQILLFIWCSAMLTTYAQVSNDIGVQSIQPLFLCAGDTDSVHVQVRNYGINPIDSFMVYWNIDAIQDSTWIYQPLDTIGGTGSDTVQLAVTTVTMQLSDIQISVWTKFPNGNMDNDLTNDTGTFIITSILPVNLADTTHYCENDSVILDAGIHDTYLWSNGDTSASITIADTGYYTVTVTDQQCSTTDSIWVESILDPVAIFQDTSSLFTVALMNLSQNADFFHWSFGDGTYSTDKNPVHQYPWTNSDSICYNPILIASNVCGSDTFGQIIRIELMYSDYRWYSSIISTINNWQVDFSYSKSAGDFYWEFGDGQISKQSKPVHIYSSNGIYECYTVQVRALTHCGYDYVRKRIAVGNYPASNPCQIVTDVPKIELNPQEITVYPNPAHDILQIDFTPNSYQNAVVLELYDILGKQVLKEELSMGQNQIMISQLPVGVYTYRIGNIRGLVVVK